MGGDPRPGEHSANSSITREPPTPDTRDAADDWVLGIDLGATKVVSGMVARDGSIVRHSGRHLHRNDGPEGVIRTVVASARACLDGAAVDGRPIGVAVAAQVDPSEGLVVHAPNLGWTDHPLAKRIEEELGAPVVLVNDARAATFAEWRHGAGVGTSDLFFLSLGTGVGGSAVVDGRLLEGGNHALGEVGHLTIVASGRPCHCPNRGCFEAYVGGWAIAERARQAAHADPTAARELLRRSGDHDSITAQAVFRSHRAGDPFATRLVEETGRYLADGAVSVVNAFNPSLLVLGGGLVAGMPEFRDTVESAVRDRCQPSAAGARVLTSRLGEDAGLIGAAGIARKRA
jgi:glucokinase